MKGIIVFLYLLVALFVAYHAAVYIHEWTHGTVAWICGYKSSPFDIHYGTEWIALLDIDQNVNTAKIFADGRPNVVAAIAIAPTLLGAALFLVGLKLLHKRVFQGKWVFPYLYWFTLIWLAEFYGYIPIRTFAGEPNKSQDVFDFLLAMNWSPWAVAIPGTLFVIWGVYRFFWKEFPSSCHSMEIHSKWGRSVLLFFSLLYMFGYTGGVGFTEPYRIAHLLSLVSWGLFLPLFIFFFLKRIYSKCGD